MSYKPEVMDMQADVAFRIAHAGDDAARAVVARLAALDSAPVPPAPYVIAARAGRPVAARSLASGATVADPFVRTADILPLLAMRAAQVQRPAALSRPGGRWRWARLRAT